MFKKINNYNLSNTNRYNEIPTKNNYNNSYLYKHISNIYPRMNIINVLSLKNNSSDYNRINNTKIKFYKIFYFKKFSKK